MNIRMIHSKKAYKAALQEIEQLWSAPAKSAQAERLDVLTLLVEHYEKTHFPIDDPDPIAFIEPAKVLVKPYALRKALCVA